MKKTISSGINKGSVKVKTDFKIVKNVSSCITDGYFEYYNSKYQFSDFFNKNYQDDSWVTKKPFLLNSKNGFFYNQDKVGLELAYRDLMSLYQDLDICLKRLQDGFHDSMFIRFVFKIGMFTTQAHWELVCRNWYRGFSMALRRYYNACHANYDPTSGISYVAYFDTHFSNYLYYAIGRADQDWCIPSTEVNYSNLEIIRLSQYNYSHKDVFEDLSYIIE